ncbi:MAG TPA: hypothetical protein VFR80_06485 [Pyrinomonadaceae bacterium]|nr:hypothetical protein [Pyrinomonadaceae bacterium]
MAPEVCFWINSRMAIIPQNPDDALCFAVIDFLWELARHAG